eukprot:TRINITY_DN15212_c0_g1_i1.p1 TRINITY_DN15212_c0_g1~~TRINITY_DN15212_c0_g1_i1.p1  ORF type:complete len:483 (+),score=127.11 TRINITY_DN15212_c0_g1_i1:60-1508(+)
MSVIIETTFGDLEVDLYVEDAPITCTNFLKLCKIKYYNNCKIHSIQKDYNIQTGDPELQNGKGGSSIYGLLEGQEKRYFKDEFDEADPPIHDRAGLLSTANLSKHGNASAFFFTTGNNMPALKSLNGKHTVFGEIVEGLDVLDKLNNAYCNEDGIPYQTLRIRHTIVIEDPFDDPEGLELLIPDRSPEPIRLASGLLDDEIEQESDKSVDEKIEELAQKEEKARTNVLVMLGDIKDEKLVPPENVLFICKINPITEEEDLELIFSQFGKVVGCDIIRDFLTGDSLCFGFIEFESIESCETAYLKMQNAVIDDRRIHVDFCQSVAKLQGNTSSSNKSTKGSKYSHLMSANPREQSLSNSNSNKRKRNPHNNNKKYHDNNNKRFKHNNHDRYDQDHHYNNNKSRNRNRNYHERDRDSDIERNRDRNHHDNKYKSKEKYKYKDRDYRHKDKYRSKDKHRDRDSSYRSSSSSSSSTSKKKSKHRDY